MRIEALVEIRKSIPDYGVAYAIDLYVNLIEEIKNKSEKYQKPGLNPKHKWIFYWTACNVFVVY